MYDAVANSYSVSVPGRSATFTSANLIFPGNYRRVNGAVIDDLTLTRPGVSGSAPLTYQYVGAGFWQRQTVGPLSTAGSIDAFVYGVRSPSRPVSGKAFYAIEVLGAINEPGIALPDSFNGSGGLVADFADSSLRAEAEFRITRPSGYPPYSIGFPYDGILTATATIAADAPTFSGNVEVNAFVEYNGTITGGFFGPGQQDVGASFSAANAAGTVLVGALLGTKDESLAVLPLADLEDETHFFGLIGGGGAHFEVMAYDPDTETYTVPEFDLAMSELSFGPAERASSQPDGRFIEYNVTKDGQVRKVLIYRTGSDNSEVELTYTGFARVDLSLTDENYENTPFRDLLYGSRTKMEFLPRTGTASYSGRLYGHAVEYNGPGDSTPDEFYTAEGTAAFIANFANYQVSVDLHPFLTSLTDGSVIDFGVHSGSGGISPQTAAFDGSFDGDGSTDLTGYFFGPNAEEIGAGFALREYDGGTFQQIWVLGVAVGTKD